MTEPYRPSGHSPDDDDSGALAIPTNSHNAHSETSGEPQTILSTVGTYSDVEGIKILPQSRNTDNQADEEAPSAQAPAEQPGVFASPRVEEESQPVHTTSMPEVRARLVDENEERQRWERLNDLERLVQDYLPINTTEPSAVAIPMVVPPQNRQHQATTTDALAEAAAAGGIGGTTNENQSTGLPQNRRKRLLLGSGLVVAGLAIIVGVLFGTGVIGGNSSSEPTPPTGTDTPKESPTDTSASVPTAAPTPSPTTPAPTGTLPPDDSSWIPLGATLTGNRANEYFGTAVALSSKGNILASCGIGKVGVYSLDRPSSQWNLLGQELDLGFDLDGVSRKDVHVSVALAADGSILAVGGWKNDGSGNDNGRVRLFEFNSIENSWEQLGQTLNGEESDDRFGESVSLSADGKTLAVGAIWNDGGGDDSGQVLVYSFHSSSGRWVQLGQELNGNRANDHFGNSVSLSSDGMIVAAGGLFYDGVGSNSGHARVFTYNHTTSRWDQLGKDLDGEAAHDGFGRSVSLSADGTIVAVGGDGYRKQTGHVRVYWFNRSRNQWVKLGGDLNGETEDDHFGFSVALSSDGTILAAGGPTNSKNAMRSGHVRLYKYYSNARRWAQLGQNLDGEAEKDKFGTSVALSADGTIVASGSDHNDDNGSDSGHVRVFEIETSEPSSPTISRWDHLGQDLDGEDKGDKFGESVAVSAYGTIVAAGANLHHGTGGVRSGRVRVFSLKPSSRRWTQLGQDLDGEFALDNFGISVALSRAGTIVAAGGFQNDGSGTNSGHVRVYEYDTADRWNQLGQAIEGKSAGDQFGISVDLSSDGMVVAAGAYMADTVHGTDTGRVLVFSLNRTSNNWNQLGEDLNGEAPYDRFGRSVALSGDGSILAASAYRNDGAAGSGSGHVRLYEYDSSADQWTQLGQDLEGEDAHDEFGQSVALSRNGSIVAAGSDSNNDRGHVRVYMFDRSSNLWAKMGQSLVGAAKGDRFGNSLALSADGTIVAVGGYNGTNDASGLVQLYQYDSATDSWTQLGHELKGESPGDNFGRSVSLSADGSVVVGGGPLNEGKGHVRVFEGMP